MEPHFDKESKISIILDGVLHEKHSQTHIQAGKGSLVIKPNNVKHEDLFVSKKTTILSLCFTEAYPLPPVLKKWLWVEHPKLSFLAIRLWYSLKSVKNDSQLNNHISLFVEAIEEINRYQDKSLPVWLESIKSDLDNVQDSLHISEISRNNNLHRGHISRTFKKHYSVSPVVYRNYVRLNNLMYSFSSDDKSLVETAYEFGFADQSHMSRIIKKETGITARNFRTLAQSF
jgi:AraC-like DNA-binding protein